MDLRKLKTLIDLVAESGIAEIAVTEGEDKVRIVKHASTLPAAPPAPVPTARWSAGRGSRRPFATSCVARRRSRGSAGPSSAGWRGTSMPGAWR